MKKVVLIGLVLLVAVISTACINNFAVRDLNNKAIEYMNNGDYNQAIERLKSSLDLDSSIFETHYNLAIAYTKAEDYQNAINEYIQAIKIKPDSADSYYSLAITQNNLAIDMTQGKIRLDENNNLYTPDLQDDDIDQKYILTDSEENYVEQLKDAAVNNLKKYLELNPDSKDREEIENIIEKIINPKQPETSEVE